MTAKIINGREIARQINETVKEKINLLAASVGRRPKLVSLSVGSSEDAGIYVNMQRKTAELVGIEFVTRDLPANSTQETIVKEIDKINRDKTVHAVIVQKPLPAGVDHDKIVASVKPEKDAEGIHPYNLGKILRMEADLVPCTPGAVLKILHMENIELYGKEVVVIGHSANVGKPLSLMLLNEMATVTVCHLGTSQKGDIISHAKRADILIVAVGKAEMVKGSWVKKGAVVIDVGINKVGDKIVGDVNFKEAIAHASVITPVPGGVGPVTVSILMRNVFRAYRDQNVKL